MVLRSLLFPIFYMSKMNTAVRMKQKDRIYLHQIILLVLMMLVKNEKNKTRSILCSWCV